MSKNVDSTLEYVKDRINSYKGGYMPISYAEEILIKLASIKAELNRIPVLEKKIEELEANVMVRHTMNKS